MKIIKGNILDIKEGIICHQVNCMGVAGAGLAKQIRDKYPQWYNEYQSDAWGWQYKGLGNISTFEVSESPELIIVNMFAQLRYGRTKQHTDYNALRQCLEAVRMFYGDRKVYLPYGVGAGLGGGLWQVISGIIEDVLPSAIIVELEE